MIIITIRSSFDIVVGDDLRYIIVAIKRQASINVISIEAYSNIIFQYNHQVFSWRRTSSIQHRVKNTFEKTINLECAVRKIKKAMEEFTVGEVLACTSSFCLLSPSLLRKIARYAVKVQDTVSAGKNKAFAWKYR